MKACSIDTHGSCTL